MDYELYCITLPNKVIEVITEIENQIAPREALETLLVCAGGKPGDKIEWLRPDDKIQLFNKKINKIKKILPNVQSINDRIGEVIYFNDKQTTIETAKRMAVIFEENLDASIEVGLFYGYDHCCTQTDKNMTGTREFTPGTEHFWCKSDCESSIKIQENNYKIIKNNIPEFKEYLDNFGKLK
ncbi:MAG TPA: hypothetical protein VI790_04355 [Candidatus Nanoarchaeia archaeon]|nr:hypothetical protein [Candidatus Nanoarchaeia archaeon]